MTDHPEIFGAFPLTDFYDNERRKTEIFVRPPSSRKVARKLSTTWCRKFSTLFAVKQLLLVTNNLDHHRFAGESQRTLDLN